MGLLIFIPGLARLFILTFGFSGMMTGISIKGITYGTYAGLIFYDLRKGYTVKPYPVGLLLVILTDIVIINNKSVAWQWGGG